MKQIQKPANTLLRPFRKLAVAGCLVAILGCGSANHAVVPDYWGMRHTEVSHTKARLTSLFREKTVDIAGTKVSFVIPNASLSNLDQATKRHEEREQRDETLFMRHLVIKNVPFGFASGKSSWSKLSISYAIEKGEHHVVATFDEKLDPNPTIKGYVGVRDVKMNDFAALLRKLGAGDIHDINMAAETIGMPTTVFGIPLDSKSRPIGNGPWGQLVAGISFNPSNRELVARPVVIVAEGKSREDARGALMQKLGNP